MPAFLNRSAPEDSASNQENLLQVFRDGTYMVFGFALAPFLTPFSIYSFVNGRLLMGVLTALIISFSLANSIVIMRQGRRILPYWVVYLPILAAFGWGIVTVSPMVAFWCYPVSIVTLFVSSRSFGRLMTLLGIVVIVPCAFVAMDTQSFVRFAPTYVMACYFVDLVVGHLDRLQTKLTDLAITDSLTGAYNRRHFDVVLADALEQHRRGQASVSLLTLDVDNFKHINDRFGHGAGDEVLAGLVRTVAQRIRSIDTLCRVGGEEFALIARGIEESDAIDLGDSLRAQVANAGLLAEMPVTISIGVAQFHPAEDRDDLVRRCDRNLYEAKQRGRNRVWPNAACNQNSEGHSHHPALL